MNFISKISVLTLTFIIMSCAYGNKEFTFDQAIKNYKELGLALPTPEKDGRIQTLNEKGALSPVRDGKFDAATAAFMEYIKTCEKSQKSLHVIEVGAGYGCYVPVAILKNYPGTIYALNDLDARHLFIAAHELKSQGVPEEALKNVKFIAGDITKLNIQEKYDAVLIARVLHFFSPPQLEAAVKNIFSLLKPGGRVYVIAITPWVKRYESFIPEYQKRVKKGDSYPGYVTSLNDWLNKEATTASQAAAISKEPFMFLDEHVMARVFAAAGFEKIRCEMVGLGYHSEAWTLEGHENVIYIGEKPQANE